VRVLFLTCHLPYPPHSGGRLREHELLSRLTQRFPVHVVAVTKTLAEDEEAAGEIPWEHDGISLFPAAQLAALDGRAPQVARHRSERASAGLHARLASGRFDMLHVEGFYLWPHVARRRRPSSLLVEQNIEWQLYEQRGLAAEARATRRAELAAWRQADALGALTTEDRGVMHAYTGRAVHLIPDGADHLAELEAPAAARSGRQLLMVGNFGYEPNVDGAIWLVDEVLPRIRALVPDAQLQLVGASPPPEIEALRSAGVEVSGRVPDVRPYLERADVVLCPLRFGGGVKVKTLEALAAGRATVSTEVGCQGLGSAGVAIAVENSAERFAAAAAELLMDPVARMRAEAAAAAVRLPCWDDAAEVLAECWARAGRESLAAA
jgi:glycosyltransferase involved in cell wall biosynthesis